MRIITVVVDIDRPAADVYAFLEDVENNPTWLRGMRSATWTTSPPVRLGSTYEQHARFLGKDIITSFEVTHLDPPRSITITSRRSPFPLTVTRAVAPLAPGRARVTETVDSDPAGFYRIATPVLARLVERSIRADYRRLKRHLEAQATGPTAR